MALIKIDKDRYINPDRVMAIIPHAAASDDKNTVYAIILSERLQITAPQSVIDYITQTTDADNAAVFTPPEALPLASRLAIYLRDQVAGQPLSMLETVFDSDVSLQDALNELLRNSVIKMQFADGEPYFYHASNVADLTTATGMDSVFEQEGF